MKLTKPIRNHGGQHAPPVGDSTLHHVNEWDFSVALEHAPERIDPRDEYCYRWPDGDVQRDEARALETFEAERRALPNADDTIPF
jgi:hypothetical protein